MKLSYLLLLFTVSFCNAQTKTFFQKTIKYHNKIDDAKTAKDVESLIETLIGKKGFSLNENMDFADSGCIHLRNLSKAQSWVKADLDNNGYTDLLAIGKTNIYSNVICIMDSGQNHFFFKMLTSYDNCGFATLKNIRNSEVILYYHYPLFGYRNLNSKVQIDTLAYKFGLFLNYNPSPKHINIEKIEFENTQGFCLCPIFKLTIHRDRTVEFNAIKYNKIDSVEVFGKFKAIMDKSIFDEFVSLLNYIDFSNLKKYSSQLIDVTTTYLSVIDNHHKVIKIEDSGTYDSPGLTRLHELIYQLKDKSNWKRIQ